MTDKETYYCGVEDCGYCRATDITDDGYVWHDKRLLPCPFCGEIGVSFRAGETFRWRVMYCVSCEASCGEIRYNNTTDDGGYEKKTLDLFERGLEIWNTRA